jgi:hypothetical protein
MFWCMSAGISGSETQKLLLANRTSKISLVGCPLFLEVSHETEKLRLAAHAVKMRIVAIHGIHRQAVGTCFAKPGQCRLRLSQHSVSCRHGVHHVVGMQ